MVSVPHHLNEYVQDGPRCHQVLNRDEFKQLMLYVVQDIQENMHAKTYMSIFVASNSQLILHFYLGFRPT